MRDSAGKGVAVAGDARIEAGLRRIRLLRRVFLVVAGGYLPVVVLLYYLDFPPPVVVGAAAVLMTAGVVVEIVIGFARCPSCRAHFHVRGLAGNLLTRRCMNCGIPLRGDA